MRVAVFGAGFSGAACARSLADNGCTVKVFERRGHIGGNAYDYGDGMGILVQKYGPHIFHTNSERVYRFLSRFTEWVPYRHRVLGYIDGMYVPIPFNLKSLEMLFEGQKAARIADVLKREYGEGSTVPVLRLRAHPDTEIAAFGEYVYQKVFYNYTVKQWGFSPDELPARVTARVPVRISYEDGYFTDKYQCMPAQGFTRLIENMLSHPNIELELGCDKKLGFGGGTITIDGESIGEDDRIVYTGCLDELLENRLGELQYRSLRFEFETHALSHFQPAAVVNHPGEGEFTRVTEFTKFTCPPQSHTVTVTEFPMPHRQGITVPCYPVEREENTATYRGYVDFFKSFPAFHALGRLAEYKYYNMDAAVENALAFADGLSSARSLKQQV